MGKAVLYLPHQKLTVMEQIIIIQGIIHDPEFNADFVFRSMLNMPIGQAYLYFPEGSKPPEVVEREMAILNVGDQEAPVYHATINKAWPIFWKDGMPEIPIAHINIFDACMTKDWNIVSVEKVFRDNYDALQIIYSRHCGIDLTSGSN